MGFFVVFLYCLRIYNIANIVDLKVIVKLFNNLTNLLSPFSLIFKSYLIIFCILIIINSLLILALVHKYFIHQLHILYIFLRYNTIERNQNEDYFTGVFIDPFDLDLISYWIKKLNLYLDQRFFYYSNNFSWELGPAYSDSDKFNTYRKAWDLYTDYIKKRPWYHIHNLIFRFFKNRYYRKIFIPFSPILVIIYDCIFNNFVLIHVYYYLLLYVPLMLWRRITIFISMENYNISEVFWDILYKDENCFYALPINHKKLFDVYIANGIKTIIIPNVAELDLVVTMYIKNASKFKYNVQEKYYQNSDLVEIHEIYNTLINDPIKVLIWVNGEEHYEDWYIIAMKIIK
jgi:hypothetical protein